MPSGLTFKKEILLAMAMKIKGIFRELSNPKGLMA
jgi:hypothetical protein